MENLKAPYETCKDAGAAKCINCIRCLAPALPFKAKSGHPGAPMGCAVMAHALWSHVMNFAPKNPTWWNRDRFVLSNGHACALQYVMLYLAGYNLSLDDLKNFRQLHSRTPGHPECLDTEGIEVTSGPLGQGISQAVGLAIARENLAATYNRPDITLFDNFTFVIAGDGCMQEGVASEACSLAGTLKLGSLIVLYDFNGITIDGSTDLSYTENVEMRFLAYGWQVLKVEDGNKDLEGILNAIKTAKECCDKPTLIMVHTVIGYGSKLQGTAKSHGSPLSEDDIKNLRSVCGLSDDLWDIPQDVVDYYRKCGENGNNKAAEWEAKFAQYASRYSKEAAELIRRFDRQALPDGWMSKLPVFTESSKPMSTRSLSEQLLNTVHGFLPELIGGSADLKESNKTAIKEEKQYSPETKSGKYIYFGVREHGMVAICNGLFAYGGFKPFSATFLNFYTYAWGAVRLGALSQYQQLMIATHDSIELGEDGPTHQPIETPAILRATPNVLFIRPCDGNEVSGAYASWLTHPRHMTCLALCRGNVPHLAGTSIEKALKGAYVLRDFTNNGKRKVCLASSGSEVQHAVAAATELVDFDVRVVSMPCWELFEEQSQEYKDSVLPKKNEAICGYMEPFNPLGIERYFERDASIFLPGFGASAPAKELMKHFGFNGPAFAAKIREYASRH